MVAPGEVGGRKAPLRGTPRAPKVLRVAAIAVATSLLRSTPGTLFCAHQGLYVPRGDRLNAVVAARAESKTKGKVDPGPAVVDDSDIEDTPVEGEGKSTTRKGKGKSSKSSSNVEDFESLMKAADKFAAKKKKRVSDTADIVSSDLEDDLRGLSVQDDADFKDLSTGGFQGKRRLDLTLEGRWRQWSAESMALIRKPTQGQKKFVALFGSSVFLVIILFGVTFSLGAIKFKGDVDQAARNERLAKAPILQKQRDYDVFRSRALQVDRMDDLAYYDSEMNDMRLKGIFPKGEQPALLPKAPEP